MRTKRYLFIKLLLAALVTIPLTAQEKIVKISNLKELTEPHPKTNEALVLVKSAIEDIVVKTNMDNPVDKPSTTVNGIYTYKLVVYIGEDELDGAQTVSRQLQVSSQYGNANLKCKVAPGKQYECVFSIPPEFAYADESVSGGLYASSQAQIAISSTIPTLTISYNNQEVIKEGVIQAILPSFLTINRTKDTYFFRFALDGTEAQTDSFKKPIFKISHTNETGETNRLEIWISEEKEVKAKTSLKYRIFYKNIANGKESFAELVEKARAEEEEKDFLSAATHYKEARTHSDCPKDQETELEALVQEMYKWRKIDFMAGTFMSEAERVENSKGFEDDSVFIYNRGVIRCLNDLLEKYPDYLPYLKKREELEAKLEKHPMNFKTEVQTKIVRHQVITGKGYEGGIDIFAAYSKKKNTKAQDRIGRTKSDGTFRIVLENELKFLYFYGDKESTPITSRTKELNR